MVELRSVYLSYHDDLFLELNDRMKRYLPKQNWFLKLNGRVKHRLS
jgi:hypothetical protein